MWLHLDEVQPSERARELAGAADARRIEVILRESRRIVRSRPPALIIAETRHGFVCASAGVDQSNAKGPSTLILLPLDPDASAQRLRERSSHGASASTSASSSAIPLDVPFGAARPMSRSACRGSFPFSI